MPIASNPYAIIEVDPTAAIVECKRTSIVQSPGKMKRTDSTAASGSPMEGRNSLFSKRVQAEVSSHRAKLTKK